MYLNVTPARAILSIQGFNVEGESKLYIGNANTICSATHHFFDKGIRQLSGLKLAQVKRASGAVIHAPISAPVR